MAKSKLEEHIETLAKKATETTEAHHAMNFAQAALNLSHAIACLEQTKRDAPK